MNRLANRVGFDAAIPSGFCMGETEQLPRPLARAIASRPVQTNTDKDLEPDQSPFHKFLVSETAELHLLDAALSRAPAHTRASAHTPAREAVRL